MAAMQGFRVNLRLHGLYFTNGSRYCDCVISDVFMIVENICCQGSIPCYRFYFRNKV